MKQMIPKTIPGLLRIAGNNAMGAAEVGRDVGLAQNTDLAIRGDIQPVVTAVFEYANARATLRRTYETLFEKTNAAKKIATITRDILKLKLGSQYSVAWLGTGFERSLAMPRSADQLQPLVLFLGLYLGENPDMQVPGLNVTAAYLGALAEELKAAVSAVCAQTTEAGTLLDSRDAKVTKLRRRVSGLVAELTQLIEPDDNRWLSFGLNRPGAAETPAAPEKIEVAVVEKTTAMVKIPRVARAEYYRVYQRVVGVDAEPVAIGSPSDPDFTIEDLPQNVSIEFSVSAVNDGGESALSAPVVISTA